MTEIESPPDDEIEKAISEGLRALNEALNPRFSAPEPSKPSEPFSDPGPKAPDDPVLT